MSDIPTLWQDPILHSLWLDHIFLCCVIAHIVGDYVLQADWMALNKKNNFLALLLHTVLYTLPFCFIPELPLWIIVIIGLQHAVQDGTKFISYFMVMKGSTKFATGAYAPWSVVVMDNIMHLLFIYFLIMYFV